jgi:glucokinase
MAGQPVSVLGAGTGFGVSCLVRERDRALALTTEGGHIGFAPGDAQQMAILSVLQQKMGRVSVERILSGPGLESLHAASQTIAGGTHESLSAEEISAAALNGDATCRATLLLFCSIYGAVAGDIALAHGARGGVFIGGGIAVKLEQFLCESPFRSHFERKGRLSSYMKAIPTTLILNSDATLLGAARAGVEHWLPAD